MTFKLSKIFLFVIIFTTPLSGQEVEIRINIENEIKSLIELKKEINKAQKLIKIQVFSGSRSKAKAILDDFKSNFPSSGAIMKFETPNYKVWTKPYRTRLEADRELIKIRKIYKSAFCFK